MTRYFTRDYNKNLRIKIAPARIERASLGETDHAKKYGEEIPSHLDGDDGSLILDLRFDGHLRALVNFDKETSAKIEKEKTVANVTSELRCLESKVIIQKKKVVGIDIN